MRLAALFGGQGSQYPGMGKSLYEESAAARAVYACGSDILGFDLAKTSFEGDEAELARTKIAQPVIFAHSLAAFAAAKDALPPPAAVAGHSLGEYAALCCAGAYSMEDGFRIIAARAEVMEQAAQTAAGTMVAIVGSDEATVKEICAKHQGVWAVNFNLPNQTVISGTEGPCLAAAEELAGLGARTTRLSVGSAFHTPMMQPAADELRARTIGLQYNKISCDFYSNLTGGKVVVGDYPDYFAKHMTSPVLFVSEIAAMTADGYDTCVEYGPKKTAATLAKKNNRALKIANVEDMQSLQKAAQELSQQ